MNDWAGSYAIVYIPSGTFVKAKSIDPLSPQSAGLCGVGIIVGNAFTVMVTGLDVAGDPLTQVPLEVRTTVTASPFTGT